jgi:hypothetical protein
VIKNCPVFREKNENGKKGKYTIGGPALVNSIFSNEKKLPTVR